MDYSSCPKTNLTRIVPSEVATIERLVKDPAYSHFSLTSLWIFARQKGELVVYVSLRSISAGEELTFDYAMTDDEPYEMKCLCGTPSCRGTITGFDWKKKEIQEKYDGHVSWFIQRRIDANKQGKP